MTLIITDEVTARSLGGETHVRKTEDNIKLNVQRNGPYRNKANMRHNKKNCTIRLLLFRGDLQVQ